MGHFPVRKLLVYQRVIWAKIPSSPSISPMLPVSQKKFAVAMDCHGHQPSEEPRRPLQEPSWPDPLATGISWCETAESNGFSLGFCHFFVTRNHGFYMFLPSNVWVCCDFCSHHPILWVGASIVFKVWKSHEKEQKNLRKVQRWTLGQLKCTMVQNSVKHEDMMWATQAWNKGHASFGERWWDQSRRDEKAHRTCSCLTFCIISITEPAASNERNCSIHSIAQTSSALVQFPPLPEEVQYACMSRLMSRSTAAMPKF